MGILQKHDQRTKGQDLMSETELGKALYSGSLHLSVRAMCPTQQVQLFMANSREGWATVTDAWLLPQAPGCCALGESDLSPAA